jgi:hypothetical protein
MPSTSLSNSCPSPCNGWLAASLLTVREGGVLSSCNCINKDPRDSTFISARRASHRMVTLSSLVIEARTGRSPEIIVAASASINACGNQISTNQLSNAFGLRIFSNSIFNNSLSPVASSRENTCCHSFSVGGNPSMLVRKTSTPLGNFCCCKK